MCHQETLLEAIWSCSQDGAASHLVKDSTSTPAKDARSPMRLSSMMMLPKMSDVAARTLGCALVDICTMDTLYNDVNWPDPEFCKVTLERYYSCSLSFQFFCSIFFFKLKHLF